jgi:hypothetical protein
MPVLKALLSIIKSEKETGESIKEKVERLIKGTQRLKAQKKHGVARPVGGVFRF